VVAVRVDWTDWSSCCSASRRRRSVSFIATM
jgi:hypothetical protein